MATGAVDSDFEGADGKVVQPEELLDFVIRGSEVEYLLTVGTDGVVVGVRLVLVEGFIATEGDFAYITGRNKAFEVAVNRGEIEVG